MQAKPDALYIFSEAACRQVLSICCELKLASSSINIDNDIAKFDSVGFFKFKSVTSKKF